MAGNTYLKLASPQEARDLWFAAIARECLAPGSETVALEQSAGRIVAAPVAARRSSPAFHGAAMDGIAVKAEDTFSASPSSPLRLEIGKNAFPINTGRPLPSATNAVIMIEHVNMEEDGRFAVIEKAAFPWQHVRKTGEDIVETEIILAPGTRIGAYELGALAAGGILELEVFKKANVAIIPSGSDLVPLREATREGLANGAYLPEFNSLVFGEMFNAIGANPYCLPIVADDEAAITKALEEAISGGADLVALNAGTSAGSHDFSAEAIAALGEVFAHGVALMPGKPVVLGICRTAGRAVPVIGAPGYPVSAMLALEEFALPLLELWRDRAPEEREKVEVIPCNPLPSRPGMEERLRVKLGRVNGKMFAVPLPRGAGTVSSLSRADGIITIPANVEGINAGEPVAASLLKPKKQIEGAILAIGSHDNTLDLLDSLMRRAFPGFSIASAHVGSLGGLMAIRAGQAHIAGSHLLDPATGIYNQAAIHQHLRGVPVSLIRLVDREQGLMVLPGNPKGINSIEDLAAKNAVFINRQKGSGTRVLLDYELARLNIPPSAIKGYRDEEYTHMNVAAAVRSGRADAGLGVRAAANALGLDFIPVGVENYDLVVPAWFMADERMNALLRVIRSREFHDAATAMGGYGLQRAGELVWEYDGK